MELKPEDLAGWLGRCPLLAILRGVEPNEVRGIVAAQEAEGVAIVEVPLNSPRPLDSIARLTQAFGERSAPSEGTVPDGGG